MRNPARVATDQLQCFRRLLGRVLGVVGLVILNSEALFAQVVCHPNPDFTGCGGEPQQCFPFVDGPSFWQDPSGNSFTWQYRRAVQSPNETCEPLPLPFPDVGPPPGCCGGNPPTNSAVTAAIRIVGTRVLVDYDAPNYYCTDAGDWPPFFTCTNDPIASDEHLLLEDGTNFVERKTYLFFEHGTWDTGYDIPCGQTQNLKAVVQYGNHVTGLINATTALTALTGTCSDRRECGGAGGTSVGLPINVGSGDVMVRQQLFTIAQEPMSLPFTLTFHSSAAMFSSLISEPIGKGWTHEYNQILKAEAGTSGNRLYRITPEGYEEEYLRISPDTTWIAINPGEARGTVTQSGSEYLLTDLNGTVTHFDTTTGRWNSTGRPLGQHDLGDL